MIQQYPYKLSILLITYNHERYVSQALDSIVHQSFTGPIELIIADDCSSDRTVEIIKEYEPLYPNFHFIYLDNSQNLGITKNYQRSFMACSGEFVAVLEGDDYWISSQKLQRQYDFLREHIHSNLCAVNYYVYDEPRSKFTPRIEVVPGHFFISATDLIQDNTIGNFSVCMYRKKALNQLPVELFEKQSYDWIVNICLSRDSLIGFISEPMSVYRLHHQGAWTRLARVEQINKQIALLPVYNQLTNFQFTLEFEALKKELNDAKRIAHLKELNDRGEKNYSIKLLLYRIYNKLPRTILKSIQIIIPTRLKHFVLKKLIGEIQ